MPTPLPADPTDRVYTDLHFMSWIIGLRCCPSYRYSIHFGLSALRMHGKNDKSVLARGEGRGGASAEHSDGCMTLTTVWFRDNPSAGRVSREWRGAELHHYLTLTCLPRETHAEYIPNRCITCFVFTIVRWWWCSKPELAVVDEVIWQQLHGMNLIRKGDV